MLCAEFNCSAFLWQADKGVGGNGGACHLLMEISDMYMEISTEITPVGGQENAFYLYECLREWRIIDHEVELTAQRSHNVRSASIRRVAK